MIDPRTLCSVRGSSARRFYIAVGAFIIMIDAAFGLWAVGRYLQWW